MATYEAQQRRAAIDRQRVKEWEAERMAIVRSESQEAPNSQPIIIHTGWQPTRPPAPVDDRPGFGAGLVVGVLLVGVLALAALLISKLDGNSSALMLGLFVGSAAIAIPLVVIAWAQAQ